MSDDEILEHLTEAVLVFDLNLQLTYINTAGEIMLADSARHLLGRDAQDLLTPVDETQCIDLVQCLHQNEPLVDRELTLVIWNRPVTVNLCATPILKTEKVSGILVELQLLDRHLRIARETQLLAQQTTAQMLLRGLAHEIKNPLGGLRGAAQLLSLELSDTELKEYTQVIMAESDRLTLLLDKILKPNAPPDKTWINIHEVTDRVRQLVQAEAGQAMNVIRDYDPSLPPLLADKNQLIQALLNIAKNAVEANQGRGTMVIKTRITRQMTVAGQRHRLVARVDVIDHGPGIAPELVNQIFFPMVTGRAQGTGLGLSITQSLIHRHGGSIECSSHPGLTIFSVFLPVEESSHGR